MGLGMPKTLFLSKQLRFFNYFPFIFGFRGWGAGPIGPFKGSYCCAVEVLGLESEKGKLINGARGIVTASVTWPHLFHKDQYATLMGRPYEYKQKGPAHTG